MGGRMTSESSICDDEYASLRGRCHELSQAACAADPTLKLVRGWYYCPIWNVREPHWWTIRPDGSIHDPTANQYPSRGQGQYEPFDGYHECEQCGCEVLESQAFFYGRFVFCSERCICRCVGVG